MSKVNYGLQLYSVRDITDKKMDYALEQVAKMGYKFVEFAGFFGIPANRIKAMLADNGLSVSGTHTGWQEIANEFEKTVEFHKAIGNNNLIIPGADLSDGKKLDAFIDVINNAIPKLSAEGFSLHYHNHSQEFLLNNDGLCIHTELEKRTDILFELDTYWVYNAKIDPVATINRLADRVKIIHLKDGNDKGEGFALGEGTAPILAIRELAIKLGLVIVVESETLNPDGLSEVKRCIDFLKTLD